MTCRDVPRSIPAIVKAHAVGTPDAVALVDGDVRVSYGELAEQMEGVARGLIALGVGTGSRVAIWAPNSAGWVASFLGTLATGAAVVPINTRFKGAEAGYIIGRSGADVLFTTTSFRGQDYVSMLSDWDSPTRPEVVLMPEAAAEIPSTRSWAELLAAGAEVEEATLQARLDELGPDTVAYVLFTSGTTGKPKGALLTHGQNITLITTLADVLQLSVEDRVIVMIPLFHVFGLNIGLLLPCLLGSRAVLNGAFDPTVMMQLIQDERIALLPGPPTVFQGILDAPDRADFDLSSLRTGLISAAGVPEELVHRVVSERLVEHPITAYGLTEALVVSCSSPGDAAHDVAAYSGRVMPGVEVRVVDGDGTDLPAGETGELLVRSSMVTAGYLDDPAATAAAIDEDGWLRTGDIGLLSANRQVRITGRAKDVVIVGGFNVYPVEVEELLREHPDVADAAVVGMPDARMGEVAVAFVVAAPGAALDPAALIEWTKTQLANFKVPRHVEVLDALPLTASLKVTKQPLIERVHELAAASA